jgi:hypothetical protein
MDKKRVLEEKINRLLEMFPAPDLPVAVLPSGRRRAPGPGKNSLLFSRIPDSIAFVHIFVHCIDGWIAGRRNSGMNNRPRLDPHPSVFSVHPETAFLSDTG